MSTVLVALVSALALFLGYRWYGGYLAQRVFRLDEMRRVPAREREDNVDFVPTRRSIVFGHHFTSIAGTGPIVGPAIAVFWGWLPALLWVLVGGIFIGAVHDFGALVVSLRNHGETIGQTAGRLINRRARLLFLFILFFALSVVLGIFGLVIAQVFRDYPSSVLGTWSSLPLAIAFGFLMRRPSINTHLLTAICLLAVYATVWLGAYHLPIVVEPAQWVESLGLTANEWTNPVVFWTIVLLAYCFIASVLPVWILLQPRDFINAWQLIVALVVLVIGVLWAGFSGQASLIDSAPAIVSEMPADAPPMFPFLFITIACGSISGFHCLVSSGTTSKQIASEPDALPVGYGGMLLESGLAVMVILACCAGIGMGKFEMIRDDVAPGSPAQFVPIDEATAVSLNGAAVGTVADSAEFAPWRQRYDLGRGWAGTSLSQTVGAFVDGGASFLSSTGIPIRFGQTILAVLVACFAATTLDSATRLQRYVIQELGTNLHVKPLENRYLATGVAVGVGAAIALIPGAKGPGTGGTILWPLFGATNQLLAGLAFLVIGFYLWRRKLPIWFLIPPLILMLVVPLWALLWNLFAPTVYSASGDLVRQGGFLVRDNPNYLLGFLGLATLGLQVWMVVEAVLLFPKVRGRLEVPAHSKGTTSGG